MSKLSILPSFFTTPKEFKFGFLISNFSHFKNDIDSPEFSLLPYCCSRWKILLKYIPGEKEHDKVSVGIRRIDDDNHSVKTEFRYSFMNSGRVKIFSENRKLFMGPVSELSDDIYFSEYEKPSYYKGLQTPQGGNLRLRFDDMLVLAGEFYFDSKCVCNISLHLEQYFEKERTPPLSENGKPLIKNKSDAINSVVNNTSQMVLKNNNHSLVKISSLIKPSTTGSMKSPSNNVSPALANLQSEIRKPFASNKTSTVNAPTNILFSTPMIIDIKTPQIIKNSSAVNTSASNALESSITNVAPLPVSNNEIVKVSAVLNVPILSPSEETQRYSLISQKSSTYFVPNNKIQSISAVSNTSKYLSSNVKQVQEDILTTFTEKQFTDIVFRVGKDSIPAHKYIMRARSPVFRKVFESDLMEKCNKYIYIADSNKEDFQLFLRFLYSGIFEAHKIDKVCGVYSLADRYSVKSLHNTCRKILIDIMNSDNVGTLLNLAISHKDEDLKNKAEQYIDSLSHSN